MTASAAALRVRRAVPPAEAARNRERWAQRRVAIAWSLLFLNALTFYSGISAVHIPSIVGKGITQGALPAAFLVALSVNRRRILRPNVFLCLVPARHRGVHYKPTTPAPRYRVPDLPARGLCCHALAADAVVGSA